MQTYRIRHNQRPLWRPVQLAPFWGAYFFLHFRGKIFHFVFFHEKKQNLDGGPLIVRRARIVRRAPILRRFANSSKHAFSNVFLMGRSKICISYLFAWFKNVQYALITLICDVKEILEVLFSVQGHRSFSPEVMVRLQVHR